MAAIKLWVAATPAEIDAHVAADAPAHLLKPLHECRETPLSLRVVCRKVHEHADAAHLLALLRVRRERPDRRAAEQPDEQAPLHWPVPPMLSTKKIAHLGTAGDCCAVGFQSGL